MTNLIPLAYLNEACFLSLNVDEKKYSMILKLSQDTLKNILGGEFYEELETQYKANTLTTDNDAVYDPYIKDYLAWQTYHNYLGFANLDSTPTGIREFDDENSTIASDVKMYALQKKVLGFVNNYKGDMLNFLSLAKEKDATKYPLYTVKCVNDFSFGITSITSKNYDLFKANKAIKNNE